MRKKLYKITSLFVILVIALVFSPAGTVLAIDEPDTYRIDTIRAYQSVIETNDQLWVFTFTLEYASTPDETATEAFLIRLLDDDVEVYAVTPYSYYNDGYSIGVCSIYISAGDSSMPTWEDNKVDGQIIGNPGLTWSGGDPPESKNTNVDSWETDLSLFTARIRYQAQLLEDEYSINMIDMSSGSLKLTAYGELYFETVIPNLRVLAPSLFSTYVTNPVYTSDNYTLVGKSTMESRLTGTPFDQSGMSDEIGISEMWITSMVWLIFSGIVLYAYGRYIGTVGITWVAAICLEVGAFGGWMPTEVAIGLGILGGVLIIYPLFFRTASV